VRDGDIYFWAWKDTSERFMPYHCCACIAVVENGILRDTYWTGTSDNKVITSKVAALTYKGNVEDMRTIHESEIGYYLPEAVVDMRHPNDSRAPIYVKKDAARDAACMTELLQYRIERERSNISYAEFHIVELEGALKKVAAGKLEEVR
jgi:hypothetical protein